MRRIISLFIICLAVCTTSKAQGFYWGPKLGPTIGMQNWNNTERSPLIAYHGAVFIESIDVQYRGSLYAQLGYHTRGSSISVIGINGFRLSDGYKFNNLSLQLGAKKRLINEKATTPYYFFGIRLEYTISDNLESFATRFSQTTSALFYPIPEGIKNFVYGLSVGGGLEFLGSAYVQPAIEFTISPDISLQYETPDIPNVVSPYDGRTITIPARRIRNVTFEVSFIVRFLREVIFID